MASAIRLWWTYPGAFACCFALTAVVAARARAQHAHDRALMEPQPPSLSPQEEMIASVKRAQIPVPHIVDELEQLVKRGVSALCTDSSLRDVLSYHSPAGARIYAFSRAAPVGARLWGVTSRPKYNAHEGLCKREFTVWERLASAGGGWCAYASVDREGALRSTYVYVERARTPKVRDMFISAGFSVPGTC